MNMKVEVAEPLRSIKMADAHAIEKIYHSVTWERGCFTAPLCGVPSWVDYGTTNRGKVTCSACLALLSPIEVLVPLIVETKAKSRRAKKEPSPSMQGQLL